VRLEVVPNSVPANDRPRAVLNGDFEARGEWPAGWSMSGSGRRAYEPSLDRTIRHGGGASAKLAPRTSPPRGYGTLVQGIDAAPWRGKRVSVTSFVRGNGVLARGDLWVRVQAHDSPADGPGLGGGTCKFSGSFDWQPCQVVFDVPAAGDEIQIGIGLDGGGVLWLDDVRMAAVGRNVALRSGNSDSLRNLDFEE